MKTSPVALITGGRRGIGRGIALALADAGFNIIINDIEKDHDAEITLKEIALRDRKSTIVLGDISDLDQLDNIVTEAWNCFGRIDCLVNNAGVSVLSRGDLLDVSVASYDRNLDINLRGPFFLTQKIAKKMLNLNDRSYYRSIISISSINADVVSPSRGEYCLSKIGVSMMAKLYAARLAQDGISVHEIRPGIIQTEMAAASSAVYEKMLNNGEILLSRLGKPEDIGKAVAALATGVFGYSTGSTYEIDGGFHIKQL